tara:strand:- start:38 stop:1594 length:1557 start_codon:yes stop_codon:yes gene_type:complete
MQLTDVNRTDIVDAIALGCHSMSRCFNADDGDIPFFGATVRPEAQLRGSNESHIPGRHLNALLNAEAATGLEIDEEAVAKHERATYLSYSHLPLPLSRQGEKTGGQGALSELNDHDLREGFHALYALAAYRDSGRARELAEASIDTIFEWWVPQEEWNAERLASTAIHLTHGEDLTFIQRAARAIGPLVKYYRATQYNKALELAQLLKDKAVREYFGDDGAFSTALFGVHAHSTTCVMSSLAQLADATGDVSLLQRTKQFYDNGLWAMRDQIGWSIEVTGGTNCLRGEANNTGDILETALILGRWGHTEYYADAERILRSHLLPSQLRDVSFIVEPDNPDGVDGRANVADRLRGAFGFPAQYGHEPAGIWASAKQRIGFNLDIVGGAVGSLCEACRETARFVKGEHHVNLLFDVETDDLEVQSPYTHDELAIRLKRPGTLRVRRPPWVKRDIGQRQENGYWVFDNPGVGTWIRIPFSLPVSDDLLRWREVEIRTRFKGDEVVAMENFGTDLTFFDPVD